MTVQTWQSLSQFNRDFQSTGILRQESSQTPVLLCGSVIHWGLPRKESALGYHACQSLAGDAPKRA